MSQMVEMKELFSLYATLQNAPYAFDKLGNWAEIMKVRITSRLLHRHVNQNYFLQSFNISAHIQVTCDRKTLTQSQLCTCADTDSSFGQPRKTESRNGASNGKS